jgi:hypothetical protein
MPTLPLPDYWPVTAPLLVPEEEDDRIQAWLSERAGLWVSYTSEAEVDKGEFLAKYLTAVSYREQCTQWLDVRLCHYISPHHIAPTQLTLTPVLFDNALALTAVRGTFYHPTPQTTNLLIELDWHTQHKPIIDYKLSLRLLAADGTTLDEANDYPIGPLLPPTAWNAGDHKPGYFVLRVPVDLTPGRYPIQVNLYDPTTLATIPYTTTPDTTQALTLAELQVDDTMQLLSASGH